MANSVHCVAEGSRPQGRGRGLYRVIPMADQVPEALAAPSPGTY